jgi:thiamine biosynthesis protein ThiC
MERVAQRGYLPAEAIREEVARGRMVIPDAIRTVVEERKAQRAVA